MMTSVVPFGEMTSARPEDPTRAVTAFGTLWPADQLRLDAVGFVSPVGHTVRCESAVVFVTVVLVRTASASAGTPPTPATGTLRVTAGPHGVPKRPTGAGWRESWIRAGTSGWNAAPLPSS